MKPFYLTETNASTEARKADLLQTIRENQAIIRKAGKHSIKAKQMIIENRYLFGQLNKLEEA